MKPNFKYAITGATGLVGGELQKNLETAPTSSFNGDLCDADAVDRWIYEMDDVDALFHLAAIVPKQVVDKNIRLALHVNVNGTLNLLEALRKRKETGRKVPWVFFASTSHVYASSHHPIKENDSLSPFTFYGKTKLQAEQWCDAYKENHGLEIGIGRIFSFSHPSQPDYYFIPAMFRKISEAPKEAVLRIPGVQGERDFLSTRQICECLREFANKQIVDTINIGTGNSWKLKDIIQQIAVKMERPDLKFNFEDSSPDYLTAETTKLESYGISLGDDLDNLLNEIAIDRLKKHQQANA